MMLTRTDVNRNFTGIVDGQVVGENVGGHYANVLHRTAVTE